MVNITALERITRLINEENLLPMRRWSNRYRYNRNKIDPYLNKLIKQIRNILYIVSGDDIINMLSGIKIKLILSFTI